jgi:hypothetical protein
MSEIDGRLLPLMSMMSAGTARSQTWLLSRMTEEKVETEARVSGADNRKISGVVLVASLSGAATASMDLGKQGLRRGAAMP